MSSSLPISPQISPYLPGTGVMSSSLGKIMIDVEEADTCTEDAILGQPEEIQRMLGAAVSRDSSCSLRAPCTSRGVTEQAPQSLTTCSWRSTESETSSPSARSQTPPTPPPRALRTRRV